jgi:hypothetical protein
MVLHKHTDGLSAATFSLCRVVVVVVVVYCCCCLFLLLLGRKVGYECNFTASFFSLSCFIIWTYFKAPDDVIFTPCCQLLPRREQIILLLQRPGG